MKPVCVALLAASTLANDANDALLAAAALLADVIPATDPILTLDPITATSGSVTSSCGIQWKTTLTETKTESGRTDRPEGSMDYSIFFSQIQSCTLSAAAASDSFINYYYCADQYCDFWQWTSTYVTYTTGSRPSPPPDSRYKNDWSKTFTREYTYGGGGTRTFDPANANFTDEKISGRCTEDELCYLQADTKWDDAGKVATSVQQKTFIGEYTAPTQAQIDGYRAAAGLQKDDAELDEELLKDQNITVPTAVPTINVNDYFTVYKSGIQFYQTEVSPTVVGSQNLGILLKKFEDKQLYEAIAKQAAVVLNPAANPALIVDSATALFASGIVATVCALAF